MVHWNLVKRRQIIFTQVILLGFVVLALVIYGDIDINANHKDLKVLDRITLPLKEISGIDWRSSANGVELLAVGDQKAEVAIYNLNTKKTNIVDLSPLLMERFSLCRSNRNSVCAKTLKRLNSDWEALKVDQQGAVFLMQEHSEAILKIDPQLHKIQAIVNFDLLEGYPDHIRNSAGKFRMNSLGEGLLLLGDRFWVAKEMFPAALMEIAPSGSHWRGWRKNLPQRHLDIENGHHQYTVTGQWEMAGYSKCDFSDLARYGDFFIVLSQKCRQLYLIGDLPSKSQRFTPQVVINLPGEIKSPEALTVLPNGYIVVASDNKKIKTNTFIVEYAGWKAAD